MTDATSAAESARRPRGGHIGVLTFPVYGARLPRPGHGTVEPFARDGGALVEVDARESEAARRSVRWPPVTLTDEQQRIVLAELKRIAALRRFRCLGAVAAPDHVHILLVTGGEHDLPRLVQLVKGALARRLTVAAGDPPAMTTRGRAAPHHKWWARQYVLQLIESGRGFEAAWGALRGHRAAGATVELPREAPAWETVTGSES